MFSSLQLPFLQALGYAIANSLWQLLVLWLIAVLVNSIAKSSAHVRYVTAVSAQAAGFVWFVSTFQFYYKQCKEATLQAEQLMQHHDVVYSGSFAVNDNVVNYLLKIEGVMPYLSIAYLFLLILLLVKWLSNFRYTKQLSKTGLQPANTVWEQFVTEMADRLGIVQNVNLYLSEFAKSPLTIGYIKPIILLPLASINQLSTEQVEAVLLHELAHIKRADYLINILVSLVEIILFFNPFTRLLSKTIRKERENCCDDWVLHYKYDATMYAEALLRLAYLQKTAGFQMTAAAGKKGELLQRVKRMVQPQKTFNYKHQVIALFLITGLLFSIAWLQPIESNINHKPAASNVKEIGQKIIITPLTAQVDNPLFNAASLFAPSLQEDVKQSLADLNKTFTDSITTIAITGAQQALQKVTPVVLSTLSSAKWKSMLDDAQKEAKQSLENIDWNDADVPQTLDSCQTAAAIADAMQSKIDYTAKVKEGLAAANLQLAKLKEQNLNVYFDQAFLQQMSATALASLQSINFKAIGDSIKFSSDAINKAFSKMKEKEVEAIKKQRLEWKKARENYKRTDNVFQRIIVPTPPPLPPLRTEDVKLCNTDGANVVAAYQNYNYSYSPAFISVPVYRVERTTDAGVKTIHIINDSDCSNINIVIEIRQ